jgi:hypothetical protein
MGRFEFFSKIRGDIRKSKCSTGISDAGGNLSCEYLREFPEKNSKRPEWDMQGLGGS